MLFANLQQIGEGALLLFSGLFLLILCLVAVFKRRPQKNVFNHQKGGAQKPAAPRAGAAILLAIAVFLFFSGFLFPSFSSEWSGKSGLLTSFPKLNFSRIFNFNSKTVAHSSSDKKPARGRVLGETTAVLSDLQFKVNIPSIFKEKSVFEKDLSVAGNVSISGSTTLNGGLTVSGGPITMTPTGGRTNNNADFNISLGSRYLINGVPIITNSSLGTTVVTSSLTQVGALVSGSIANGFGSINFAGPITTTGNIIGAVINATQSINTGGGTGTVRIDSSGNLLNIGNITANGTLQNTGTFTNNGNAQINGTLTGLTGLTSSGTITFSGLSDGVVHVSGGKLTGSAVVLSSSDVSGVLPIANGGTNGTAAPTAGAVAYGTGTAYGFTDQGTAGFCLVSNGSAAPSWITCSSGSASTIWTSNNGAIYPINATQDLLLGGQSTSSAKIAFLNMAGVGSPTASISGATAGNAVSITGDGTISTALNAPLTINPNGGNVGIGTTPLSAYRLDIAAPAQGSAMMRLQGTGSLGTGLLIQNGITSWSTMVGAGGEYRIDQNGTGITNIFAIASGAPANSLQVSNRGFVSIGGNTPLATFDVREETNNVSGGIIPIASFSGKTAAAGIVVDNSGAGDIFTASKSGATKFTVNNAGNVQINNLATGGQVVYTDSNGLLSGTGAGTSGFCLVSNGSSAPTWTTCSSGAAATIWTSSLGAIYPINSTEDLLFGGQSTASAKFHLYGSSGSSGTTPVASIAATSSFAGLVVDQTGAGDIFTASKSGATKFVISNAGNVGIGTNQPSAVLDVQNSLITTGNGISGAFNGLTTGKALSITSTSTALTTGQLGSFDWSPASATTATGDLFSLNVGANGIIGNIFNVKNNGSSVFSVGQNQITAALPTQFTSPGDVSMAYDLQFTNPTASFIKSSAALIMQAGETFNSSDLTLRTFNNGQLVLDLPGGVLFSQAQNWTLATNTNALNFNSGLFNIDSNNSRVGINTTSPLANLDVRSFNSTTVPAASVAGQTTNAALVVDNKGTGDLFTASKSGATKFTVNNAGNVQINNLATGGQVVYTDSNGLLTGTGAGTSGFCLVSNGTSAPTWTTCSAGASNNLWTSSLGAIYPINSTEDLLVGGQSTASAKFAFTNVNSGVPTASISGTGGSSLSLSGNGAIATTNKQSLTIGDGNTGNITLTTVGPQGVSIIPDGLLNLGTTFTDGINIGRTDVNITTTLRGLLTAQPVTDSTSAFVFKSVGNTNSLAIDTVNNRVGIGTASPVGPLDVRSVTGNGTTSTATFSGATTFAGMVVDNSGTGDLFTASKSGATKFVISNAGNVGTGTNQPSAVLDVQNSLITTTNGISGAFNGLTTGAALNITSTSTALTTGQLGLFDWSPGSATTATGDLFSLNVGANGLIGNIFNVKNNGSSVFSVSQNQITAALPTQFTSPGDVAMAYDLQFTNPTASYVKSLGPLYIQSGESFNSLDLTLRTFNNGQVVLDAAGGVTLNQTQNWTLATHTNALNFASGLFNLDTTNTRVGVNTSTALASLDVRNPNSTTIPAASISGQTTNAALIVDNKGLGDLFTASISGLSKFTVNNNGGVEVGSYANSAVAPPANGMIISGNVGIGTSSPVAGVALDVQPTTSGSSVQIERIGTGVGNNQLWEFTAKNSANSDGVAFGQTSTTYTTGGTLATWLGNSNAFLYYPSVNGFKIGTTTVLTQPVMTFTSGGLVGISNASPLAAFDVRSQTNSINGGTQTVASFSGQTAGATVVVDNSGVGDIFTASKSGATKFVVNTAGNVQVNNLAVAGQVVYTDTNGILSGTGAGTSGFCLTSNGAAAPSWTTCSAGASNNLWTSSLGAIYPINSTEDLLVGGQSTASAKFAFMNVNSGTPTASISAGTSGALTLNASGNIQTTALQNLTLGGSTTGWVSVVNSNGNALTTFDTVNNRVGIGTTAPATMFQVRQTAQTGIAEEISRFNVSDDGTAVLKIANASNADNLFIPQLLGVGNGASTSLDITGSASTDTGNQPIIVLNSNGGIVNRPILDVRNGLVSKMLITAGGQIGLGTTIPLATFDVRHESNALNGGTVPIASFSGQTTAAGLVVDNSGLGDIFTASSSGLNRFVIKQNGNIGINTTQPNNRLEINSGAIGATMSNVINLSRTDNSVGAGAFVTAIGASFGGVNDASNSNSFQVRSSSLITTKLFVGTFGTYDGFVGVGTTTPLATFDVRHQSNSLNGGTIPIASFSGLTTNAGLIVDNGGLGDLFTASKSGASKFTINSAGNVQINNLATGGQVVYTDSNGLLSGTGIGTSGFCLTSNGTSAPTWTTCSAGAANNLWTSSLGAIYPINSTEDLLIGGQSTASAKFAFMNVNSGTPTASISAGTSGAISLTAAGNIQTTALQSLTLGGNTTGFVQVLDSNSTALASFDTVNDRLGIGVTTPTQKLQVAGGGIGIDNAQGILSKDNGGTFRTILGMTSANNVQLLNLAASGSVQIGMFNNVSNTAGIIGFFTNNSSERMRITGTGTVGIGVTSPLATFDVREQTNNLTGGITPVASFSGTTTAAALVVDNSGLGDIFTASSSGLNRFVITQNGNVGIGTTLPGSKLDLGGSGSITNFGVANTVLSNTTLSMNSSVGVTLQNIATQNGGSLTLQTATGNGGKDIIVSPGAVESARFTQAGFVAVGTTNALATLDVRAKSGTLPVASFSGSTSNAAMIVDQTGAGDIFTASKSGATKFVVSNAGNVGIGTSQPSAVLDVQNSLATTGNGISGAFNGLTTGKALSITSTSTALTTGQLASFDWSPGSATTATGDLFSLNVGANGIIGNIFNVKNNGSSVFSVGQNQITAALPTQFTSPGDVSMAYDLQFTNPTASFIKSSAPLAIQAGETFNSSDLTLRTFNSGDLVLDLPGGVLFSQAQNWTLATNTNALNFNSGLFNIDSTNSRVGINTGTALANLDVRSFNSTTSPAASISGQTTSAALVIDNKGLGDIFTASKSGASKFTVNAAGNVQVNNLAVAGQVVYTDTNGILSGTGAGTSGFCLTSNGANAPSWTTCSAGAASTLWTSSLGAIYPINSTEDLLIGGQSTASAKFGFLNVNSGTPTASISAGTTGALTLNASGNIQTTALQNLTLGGNTTGWVTVANSNGVNFANFDTVNGRLGIGITPTLALDVSAVAQGSPMARFTGTGGLGSGIQVGSNAGAWNLMAGSGGQFRIDQSTGASNIFAIAASAPANSLQVSSSGFVGVGNGSPLATFDVREQTNNLTGGIIPIASFSGKTAAAGLVVDNSGAGDIFTASSSGLNRFVIQQNGNIGVGTTTPAFDSNAFRFFSVESGTNAATEMGIGSYGSTANSNIGGLSFYNSSLTTAEKRNASISSNNDGATNNGNLKFFTSNAGALTERMRINSLGTIGIGTTSPLATLDLRSQSNSLPIASFSGATTNVGFIVDQSGNGDIFTASKSGATKFVISNAGNVGIGTTIPSAVLDVQNALITTTNGISGAFNGLTTGAALNITSTSTALTTGQLGLFDWSPGSATTATGDLFSLNVGANGIIGNIFNVKNNGSSVFSVGQSQITAALPTQFTAAGDITAGYDLQFTNPNSSFIKSVAPLYIQSGEIFNSSDLTLRTFNSGNIVLDAAGGVTLNQSQNWTLATGTNALNIGSNLFVLDTTNTRAGINAAIPLSSLDVRAANSGTVPIASFSGQTTNAGLIVDNSGLGDIFTASSSGLNRFVIKQSGNVGIGTATPATLLDVNGAETVRGNFFQTTGTNGLNLSSSTTAFSINGNLFNVDTQNSRVGIGNASPAFKLDVSDSQATTASAMIFNSNTGTNTAGLIVKLGYTGNGAKGTGTNTLNGNRFIAFLNGNGSLMGSIESDGGSGVSYTAKGIDLAEYFTKDDPHAVLPIGTMVCQGQYGVRACTANDSSKIVGIISEHPAFVGGINGPDKAVVALVGQVPLRVTTQNGQIKSGDTLTVSSAAGVGTKLTGAKGIVGTALGDYTNDDTSQEGQVMVFIHSSYADTDSVLSQSDLTNFTFKQIVDNPTAVLTSPLAQFVLQTPSGQTVDRIVTASHAMIADLKVGTLVAQQIKTDTLQANHITIQDVSLNDYIAQEIAKALTSSNSAQLASTSSAQTTVMIPTGSQLSPLVSAIVGTQSAQLVHQSFNDIPLSDTDVKINVSAASITQYLDLAGSAYVGGSVGVQRSVIIGKGLSLTDNNMDFTSAVSTPNRQLNILASGQGSLSILKGVMNITDQGEVAINGDIMLNGRLTYSDQDVAGFAAIPLDQQDVTVTFVKPFSQKPIIALTAEDYDGVVSLHGVSTTGFTIHLQNKATKNVTVNWSATLVKDAKTTVGQVAGAATMSGQLAPTASGSASLP